MSAVEKHFDSIAKEYDSYKKMNWYFYSRLKSVIAFLVPEGRKVLDAGCGTGDILSLVRPSRGVGIDVSSELLKIAREKHRGSKNLEFIRADIVSFFPAESFDYVIATDIIEHLEDVEGAIKNISRLLAPGAKFINTMANPLWEPILEIAEKLGLKMPEGPHYRISGKELVALCARNNLALLRHFRCLPFPKYIPIVSNVLNAVIEKTPLLKKIGFIEVFEFQKK